MKSICIRINEHWDYFSLFIASPGQVRKTSAFPTMLRKIKILLHWNRDTLKYNFERKLWKAIAESNTNSLVFKIQEQFCLNTEHLHLSSVTHFIQRISEYSSREEGLSKGQSKKYYLSRVPRGTKGRERELGIHSLEVQHFTVHIQE